MLALASNLFEADPGVPTRLEETHFFEGVTVGLALNTKTDDLLVDVFPKLKFAWLSERTGCLLKKRSLQT